MNSVKFEVSSVECLTYENAEIKAALSEALERSGGLDFLKPGMKIAIKANLVAPMSPEKASTVHPVLLGELCKILFEHGASEVVIGDSPGGLFNTAWLAGVYRSTGIKSCEETGATLNSDFSVSENSFEGGKVMKSFTGTGWLDNYDAIVNVCKLKTHGMMGMSNSVKNLFGCIPGTMKMEYHSIYPNHGDFADMLVDLNEYYKPALCVCDAVVGMEGNGPTAGKPRQIGRILTSTSPYKLDICAAKLIGLGVDDVPTLGAAYARGLAPATAEEVSVYGALPVIEDFDNISIKRKIDFSNFGRNPVSRVFYRFAGVITGSKPKVNKNECIGCGKCAKVCPQKTIEIKDKVARIKRSNCIKCFCCQEFCPVGAMKVKRSPLGKLLMIKKGKKKKQ